MGSSSTQLIQLMVKKVGLGPGVFFRILEVPLK